MGSGKKNRCVFIENVPYHLIARVNAGEEIFLDAAACELFLVKLEKAKARFPCKVWNFIILPSSIQLLVNPETASSLPLFMKQLLGTFGQYFNLQRNRLGHVWCLRYRRLPVMDDEDFKIVFKEISLGAVTAGLADLITDYPYCGMHHILQEKFTIVEPLSDTTLPIIEELLMR
jgi:REP element-mobilizing transposase RayT